MFIIRDKPTKGIVTFLQADIWHQIQIFLVCSLTKALFIYLFLNSFLFYMHFTPNTRMHFFFF